MELVGQSGHRAGSDARPRRSPSLVGRDRVQRARSHELRVGTAVSVQNSSSRSRPRHPPARRPFPHARRGGRPPYTGPRVRHRDPTKRPTERTTIDTRRDLGTRLRLALIGSGWITPAHLDALDRLGRTTLVGVASPREESARAIAGQRGALAFTSVERLLDETRPDVVYVCVPPSAAVGVLDLVVERGVPFLTEKPLAATDADGPSRIATAVEARGLVAAVGYHLRALEGLAEVRALLAGNPAHLMTARWLSGTPAPAWWLREAVGGGQVVEQATHFYDLGRHLVGEAEVVGAVSTREEPVVPAGADVVDATAATVRFETGAVGSFANTRRLASARVEVELAAADLLVTIRRVGDAPGSWAIDIDDGQGVRTIPPGRDPYEAQAEAFLDAVVAGTPDRVLATYADALRTDGLTRAVVAATGRPG